jgi:hypothetical protein
MAVSGLCRVWVDGTVNSVCDPAVLVHPLSVLALMVGMRRFVG